MLYDFTFYNPTQIHFGKNAMAQLPAELQQVGESVLLVYGKSSIKRSGLYDRVMALLHEAGKTVVELSGINSNPRWSQLEAGCRLVREHHVSFILAVGGGSVIDCAKGISACAYATGNAWERYYLHQEPVDNAVLPIGTILTMAGTGSEMNGGSVITNEEQHLKVGRVYNAELNPRFSILNPEFTYTVPTYQMVSGIFDTFSHLLEQYLSGDDDNTSDYLLEGAMRSLIVAARAALHNPQDYEARSNIMWCATVALNKSLGVSKQQDWMTHQIEHQLGAYTDCAHGIGLAILTPAYLKYIMPEATKRLARFAHNVWELPAEQIDETQLALQGIARLEAFIRELGIPATLREVGATEDMLESIADSTDSNVRSRYGEGFTGYKCIRKPDILHILRACF